MVEGHGDAGELNRRDFGQSVPHGLKIAVPRAMRQVRPAPRRLRPPAHRVSHVSLIAVPRQLEFCTTGPTLFDVRHGNSNRSGGRFRCRKDENKEVVTWQIAGYPRRMTVFRRTESLSFNTCNES